MDDAQHQEIARGLFRESNDALFLFDPRDHRVVDLNPVAQRLTGLDRAAAGTLRVWQLFSSGEGRGIVALIDAYQRTGFFHSREGFVLNRRHGAPIPVNVSVSRIHTRPAPLGLVVARDISERLRAQEELRESERRFRSLVESARVLILTLSASGMITSVNPEFEVITDWARDEWLGNPIVELLHPEDRARAQAHFERALGDGSAPAFEARLATKYADYCDLEVLSLSRVAQGKTIGLSLIARDVTHTRRAEEAIRRADELRRAKELAEVADQAKSAFLAQVSHEVRTPLTAILNYGELLQEHPHTRAAPEDFRDAFAILLGNAQHLLNLIDDLLDLSRIETGRLRIEPADCDPAEVVADVVATLQPEATAAGATLHVDPAPEPAGIRTDPERLRQILLNLVSNAIHYAGGGPVRIRSRFQVAGTVGGGLAIEVLDSGQGLSPEDQERIFEPFDRGSAATARQVRGAGLGLAISRRLAELLGGQLAVDSVPGQGSTFILTLPAGPDQIIPTSPASVHGPAELDGPMELAPALEGLRILLAEDSEANRRAVALRLEHQGACVTGAADGQAAVDLALEADAAGRPFDLLLLDLQMPAIDGIEAARRLRDRGLRAPMIALTAHATVEDRAHCLRCGFADVITKPIDWPRLIEVLATRAGCATA